MRVICACISHPGSSVPLLLWGDGAVEKFRAEQYLLTVYHMILSMFLSDVMTFFSAYYFKRFAELSHFVHSRDNLLFQI